MFFTGVNFTGAERKMKAGTFNWCTTEKNDARVYKSIKVPKGWVVDQASSHLVTS